MKLILALCLLLSFGHAQTRVSGSQSVFTPSTKLVSETVMIPEDANGEIEYRLRLPAKDGFVILILLGQPYGLVRTVPVTAATQVVRIPVPTGKETVIVLYSAQG